MPQCKLSLRLGHLADFPPTPRTYTALTAAPRNVSSNAPAAPQLEIRRDESLDIAKGFGIVLVVLGHVLDGLIAAKFFPSGKLWPELTVYVIYLFHMPLFFLISGHLASGKHRPPRTTLAKLIPTIVYPYFLWSTLEAVTLFYMNGFTNTQHSDLALYRILWMPIVPYWFLYALFFCHVLYLLTRRLSRGLQIALAVAIFAAPFFVTPMLVHFQLLIVLETVRGFLFFTVGVISVRQVQQLGPWAAAAGTALFTAMAVMFYQSHLGDISGAIASIPVALAGIAATIACSRVLSRVRQGLMRRPVGWIAVMGRYSMSIYVMHIFFTAGVRIALKRLAQPPNILNTVIELSAATVAGVILPLGFNWLVSRLNLDRWFGLQHMEVR